MFLSRWWPKIDRKSKDGAKDRGDLTHPEDWAVECKNTKGVNLPQYLREAEAEATHKGARFFVALVKNRRSKGESGRVEDGYAVTRTRVWGQVAREHEIATEALADLEALAARWSNNAIRDSSYAVLTAEAVSVAIEELRKVSFGEVGEVS